MINPIRSGHLSKATQQLIDFRDPSLLGTLVDLSICNGPVTAEPGARPSSLVVAAPSELLKPLSQQESQRDSATKPRVASLRATLGNLAHRSLNLEEVVPTPRMINPIRSGHGVARGNATTRSEEHTSELQSRVDI